MVEVTIGELLAAIDPLKKLMAMQMPIVAAHRLSRAARPIADELTAYEKSRVALFEKYGEMADDGQWHVLRDSHNYQQFEREYFDLLGDKVQLDIQPVTIDALGQLQVTPQVMGACWFLFE